MYSCGWANSGNRLSHNFRIIESETAFQSKNSVFESLCVKYLFITTQNIPNLRDTFQRGDYTRTDQYQRTQIILIRIKSRGFLQNKTVIHGPLNTYKNKDLPILYIYKNISGLTLNTSYHMGWR